MEQKVISYLLKVNPRNQEIDINSKISSLVPEGFTIKSISTSSCSPNAAPYTGNIFVTYTMLLEKADTKA